MPFQGFIQNFSKRGDNTILPTRKQCLLPMFRQLEHLWMNRCIRTATIVTLLLLNHLIADLKGGGGGREFLKGGGGGGGGGSLLSPLPLYEFLYSGTPGLLGDY